ncbi:phosphonate C-P lyase system protein PhnG [Paucibacter sp. APW11]|uniref:Phosphonate C-P lyase system protein PhnG n=1 Tax=Roseateles aquae TaxID=3077235 RepID=A0ABU3PJF2_9BURK|nr:phosphonate C-P lyase system protein PhnG [Paucibacter sp. APW11]MDT9002263.1 phosphonate C-P lyase system protein PhnG [Paucibacter sp. APW11]
MTTASMSPSSTASQARRDWLAVLAQAPREALLRAAAPWRAGQPFELMRAPETGLAMLRGRVAGAGERFNVGEATLTRCVVRLQREGCTTLGLGYRLGRDAERVRCMAEIDALLQQPSSQADLLAALIEPLREQIAAARAAEQARSASSRVRFFTLAPETTT